MRRWLAVAGLVGVLLGSAGGVAGATTHRKPEVISLPMTYKVNPTTGASEQGKVVTLSATEPAVGLVVFGPPPSAGTLWMANLVMSSGAGRPGVARRELLTAERETVMGVVAEGGATYRPSGPTPGCDGFAGRQNNPDGRRGWDWTGQLCIPFRLPVGATIVAVGWGPHGKRSPVVVEWVRAG